METGGFSKTADILQIAARFGEFQFSVYIQPTQAIDDKASQVHGLRFTNDNLECNNKVVETVSLTEGIIGFYEFLCRFNKKCILTAHNCKFDYPRLIIAIKKVFMLDRFQSVVEGFSDTLPVISKFNKQKGKGANTLGNLAAMCKLNVANAHNAVADVVMLQGILLHFKICDGRLKKSLLTWSQIAKKEESTLKEKADKENILEKLKTFKKFDNALTMRMKKKIINANVTTQMIEAAYEENKFDGLYQLFLKENITRTKKVIRKLSDFLDNIQKDL